MFLSPGTRARPGLLRLLSGLKTAGSILIGQGRGWPAVKAVSGDATLASSGALTLATTIAAAGPVGDASHVAQITYDAKGRLTTVASVAITPSAISAVATVKIQIFAAGGTYTPSTGLLYAIIECVGGGGGGGGAAGLAGSSVGAGGGGSGSYARKVASAATIGASQSVTIGAAGSAGTAGTNNGGNGGDTSVGGLCIGKGGTGGAGGGSGVIALGGDGGVGGTGDFTPVGNHGVNSAGLPTTNNFAFGGDGGSSVFGGGAKGPVPTTTGTGTNASNYGSGGSGGAVFNTTANVAGGAGTAGVVIITEYCSQ